MSAPDAQAFSLPVKGASLQCWRVGPGDAPAVVTVHSGPGESHVLMRPALDDLADEQRQVVYYDQRGGGQSHLEPGAPDGTWQEHVADLAALLRLTGTPSVVLLGHSWGALLSLLFAAEHRAMVSGLVLVAPPPLRAADRELVKRAEATARERIEVREAEEQFRREGLQSAARVAPYLADPWMARSLPQVFRSEDAARAVRASLAELDLARHVAGARGVPTLIVHGAKDPVPVAVAEGTSSLLGAALEVIPDCGHVPFLEAPTTFLRLMKRFLGAPD